MAFQSTIRDQIGFGVVGELYLEGPLRAQPARLNSGTPANNVVGRAFTVVTGATGTPLAGDAGANPAPLVVRAGATDNAVTRIFAGILANPKVYASPGTTSGGTLDSTLTLPNGTIVELVQEASGLVVSLPAASNPGDLVYFLFADGTLATAAPGAAVPAGANLTPIGKVERFVNAAASLACISVGPVS